MDSETEDAEWNKLFGITVGNPAALAVLVDISAKPGTDKTWPGRIERGPARKRLRVLSLDRVLPLVDGTRGARARLTQIVAAAKRQKHCLDPWWHLPAT